MDDAARDQVPVLAWEDYAQFEMGMSALAEAGIPYVLHGVHHDLLSFSYGMPGDAPTLRVLRADFERARDLLARAVGRGVAPPR